MSPTETMIANLATLKADRRKIKALTGQATPILDDSILKLAIQIAFTSDCRCEPDFCHECYVPSQKEWSDDVSER